MAIISKGLKLAYIDDCVRCGQSGVYSVCNERRVKCGVHGSSWLTLTAGATLTYTQPLV